MGLEGSSDLIVNKYTLVASAVTGSIQPLTQNSLFEVTELSQESKVAFVYMRGVEPVRGLLVEFFSVRFNCLLAE